MIAYKLADQKKDEEGKTVLLSIFILQKNRMKLSGIVGMEVSARKYTGAKYHAMLYGPGQAACVQVLSPDDMRLHLKMHLKDVPNLPGDLDVLAQEILGLAIDLSVLKQMDVLKITGKKGIYNQVHRRAIIAACKLVGRQAPKALLSSITEAIADEDDVILPSTPVGEEGEDDLDQAILEEEEQQDIFDAEYNNHDEEFED
jgi:hypothetical protein